MRETARFNVLALGRRWGKTTMGARIIVTGYKTRSRQYNGILKGGRVAWFAPTYKYLQEAWREVLHRTRPLATRINGSEHRAEYMTGGIFEAWTLDNPDAGRGRKYDIVVIDEAAMVKDLGAAWNLAIRPTLADLEGAAWFLSTPKGLNAFHTLYLNGQDATKPDWASWRMPSETNPHVPAHEIQAMRDSLPERVVRQEIDAEFMADGGGVFRRVREAVDPSERKGYNPAHVYALGVDWGRTNDYTCVTVINVTERRVEHIDRFTGIGYHLQTQRLRQIASTYRASTIYAETNSMGGPLVEELQRAGLPVVPFAMTGESKAPLIEELALAIEQGQIRLLDDAVAIGELQAYELERLPSGRYRYSAPAGQHDDTVVSLALAWKACPALNRFYV